MRPVTIYTIAFDRPGGRGMWAQARLLAASLMRTSFEGTLVILRNTPDPICTTPNEQIIEIEINTAGRKGKPLTSYAQWFKFHAGAHIPQETKTAEHIIAFTDCDALFLKDPSGHFNSALGKGDLAVVAEDRMRIDRVQFRCALTAKELTWLKKRKTQGVNSGCWAVPGDKFEPLLATWRAIHHRQGPLPDQNYFQRIVHLGEGGFTPAELPRTEFTFPAWVMPRWEKYRKSTHLHFCGVPSCRDKVAFMLGTFESTRKRPEGSLVNVIREINTGR